MLSWMEDGKIQRALAVGSRPSFFLSVVLFAFSKSSPPFVNRAHANRIPLTHRVITFRDPKLNLFWKSEESAVIMILSEPYLISVSQCIEVNKFAFWALAAAEKRRCLGRSRVFIPF